MEFLFFVGPRSVRIRGHHGEPRVEPQTKQKGVKRQIEKVEYKIIEDKKRREQDREAEKRKMAQLEKAELKKYKVQQRQRESRQRALHATPVNHVQSRKMHHFDISLC